jgi:hypothetical protein
VETLETQRSVQSGAIMVVCRCIDRDNLAQPGAFGRRAVAIRAHASWDRCADARFVPRLREAIAQLKADSVGREP